MPCKKDNLKKLSKENTSNVSGGWYVQYGTDKLEGCKSEYLKVFNDNGEHLGNSISFADAEILAKEHNCTNFKLSKSSLGDFLDEYNNPNKKSVVSRLNNLYPSPSK